MRWFLTPVLLLVAATSHAGGLRLEWTDRSDNEASFIIERITGPCGGAAIFAPIGSVTANSKTYDDTTVVEGQAYCYRVGARNVTGTAYSNIVEGTLPLALAIPAAPTGLGVTILP